MRRLTAAVQQLRVSGPKAAKPRRKAPGNLRSRKPLGPKRPKARMGIAPSLDARNQLHLPTPDGGNYTVLRGRVNINYTTFAGGSNKAVFLFGPHTVVTGVDGNVSNCIGVTAGGTNVPGSAAEGLYFDPVATFGNVGGAQLSLHAITVNVKVTGGGSLLPDGVCYMGAIRGRARRNAFPDYNALADSLIQRNEMRSFSNYELLTGHTVSSFPLDMTQWKIFGESSFQDTTTKGNNQSLDTLAPIVVIFPSTVAAQGVVIQVHTEWRVMFNIENIALASTHQDHKPAPPSVWHAHSKAAANQGGHHEERGSAGPLAIMNGGGRM